MSASSSLGHPDAEAQFRRTLSPSLFPAWQATCGAFGAAVAAGPGLVLLVGGPGSGKTFTLLAYAGGAGGKARLRSLDDPMKPGTQVDLVDNVHAASLARLAPFAGARALAVEPDLADRLVRAFPKARIVAMQPMRSRDVHMMVEVRRPQLCLPVGHFTSKALARLDELCAGNPRRLDDLLFRSLRLAASASVARVSPAFVEQAALLIEMAAGTGRDAESLDWEAVLQLLGRTGASSQPWRRQGGDAPGFWPAGAVARRDPGHDPGRDPAQGTGRATSPPARQAGAAPRLARQPVPLLPAARKAGTLRDGTPLATARAEATRARKRRRRTRQASAAAAVAIVAVLVLAVSARGVPGALPWGAGGGRDPNGARPVAVASLPPGAPLSPALGMFLPSLLAPAARPVSLAGALPPSGQADLATPWDAASGMAAVPGAMTHPVAPSRQAAAIADLQGAGLRDGPGQAGPRPRGASPADDGPVPAAPATLAAPFKAAAPVPAMAAAQAPASVSAAPANTPPQPVTAGQRPPPSPEVAKEAARLLALGRALLAIDQVADARELIKASADMGDSKAAALLAAYDAVAQGRRVQAGPAQHERPGTRVRPTARAVP